MSTEENKGPFRPSVILGALVGVALIAVVFWRLQEPKSGSPAPPPEAEDKPVAVKLKPMVAKMDKDVPHAERPLEPGATVTLPEVVMPRFSLDRDAFVYLVVHGTKRTKLAYLPSPDEPPFAAGEQDLVVRGSTLALDFSVLGPQIQLSMIASPTPLEAVHLFRDLPFEGLTKWKDDNCPLCGYDTIAFKTP